MGLGYIKYWYTLDDLSEVDLMMLAKEGLSTVEPEADHPAKESKEKSPRAPLRTPEAVPIQLDNNQTVWVQPGSAIREGFGYQSIRVFDAPSRIDMAIIAAVTVKNSHLITPPARVRKAVPFIEKMYKEASFSLMSPLNNFADMPEELSSEELSPEEWGSSQYRTVEEILKSMVPLLEEPEFEGATLEDLQPEVIHTLGYAKDLLRHYRPDFDELPREEQIALMQHTCQRINAVLEAVRKLVEFAEYGRPSGDSKPAVEQAVRDVKAAELHEVAGLSYPKVAEKLGEPPPSQSDLIKNDHTRVRKMAERGHDLLVRAFGEEGWQELVDSLQQQYRDWDSLDEDERWLKRLSAYYAERLGLNINHAREITELYVGAWAKRNKTTTAETCRTMAATYGVLQGARL
jgi:hypothetical protein